MEQKRSKGNSFAIAQSLRIFSIGSTAAKIDNISGLINKNSAIFCYQSTFQCWSEILKKTLEMKIDCTMSKGTKLGEFCRINNYSTRVSPTWKLKLKTFDQDDSWTLLSMTLKENFVLFTHVKAAVVC